MSTPRRRLVRPLAPPARNGSRTQQLAKLRARLEQTQTGLARWQRRLRRAFGTVERLRRTLIRLERQIARLENAE
jgi:hypothetical protein